MPMVLLGRQPRWFSREIISDRQQLCKSWRNVKNLPFWKSDQSTLPNRLLFRYADDLKQTFQNNTLPRKLPDYSKCAQKMVSLDIIGGFYLRVRTYVNKPVSGKKDANAWTEWNHRKINTDFMLVPLSSLHERKWTPTWTIPWQNINAPFEVNAKKRCLKNKFNRV